ncbi:MAG TPA: PspC domain-containing protein [Nocardioides sp.]|nr:PspC domain-containing protein [Nocardioides sp.]
MTEQSTQPTPPQQPFQPPQGQQPQAPYPAPPSPPKRLVRSREDRWLAGVCGGIGQYAGIDPNVVRLLAVVGGVFSGGTLLVAYVVAWIVMPEV